jgi:hypothetical protein
MRKPRDQPRGFSLLSMLVRRIYGAGGQRGPMRDEVVPREGANHATDSRQSIHNVCRPVGELNHRSCAERIQNES